VRQATRAERADAGAQPGVRRAGTPGALRAEGAALRDALRAEWAKARTLPGTPWLLAAIVAGTVAVSAAATAATRCPAGPAGLTCPVDTAKLSLAGVQLGQALVAILAVLAVTGEYSTGMIRTTLAAAPRRVTMLAAKAAVVTGLVLAAGTVAVGGCLLAGRLVLPGHGFTPARGFPVLSLADGPVLRAAAGSVAYLALVALLALGAATVIRDSAVAIGTVLGLMYLFPIIAALAANSQWQRHLMQIGPMTAGLEIQATRNLPSLPISPWAGLGVLAAWATGTLLAGALLLRRRDA
jgi:ABC-2 type transport system permease protein